MSAALRGRVDPTRNGAAREDGAVWLISAC